MIALVQPFGIHSPGGGPRILRSLLDDAPAPFVSVCTGLRRPDAFDPAREVHLPMRPYLGRVEHTRLSRPLSVLTRLAAPWFKRKLRALFDDRGVTRVHAIPHGLDFAYAFEIARERDLPYVLTVHDDMTYNLHDRVYLDEAMRRLATVWREADGRMVISDAMGRAYNARYGERPYAVVTDGLTDVAADVRPRETGRLNVYFMGSVHLSYEANFQSMLDALDRVARQRPGDDVRFTVRGGVPFDLRVGAAPLDVLGWGTQDDIEADLEEADLLYFPLPFAPEHDAFVRYSLSTKMVTYLGSGVPILYHGPGVAAAARLLDAHDAGLLACTDDVDALVDVLSGARPDRLDAVARGGLRLAHDQFLLRDQRRRFWSMLAPDATRTPPVAA